MFEFGGELLTNFEELERGREREKSGIDCNRVGLPLLPSLCVNATDLGW